MAGDGDVVALAALSMITGVGAVLWFAVESTRRTFVPFQQTETGYLYISMLFALPASVNALVAIPVFAVSVTTPAYTWCAVGFHALEWLWLLTSSRQTHLYVTATILILAACALTAVVAVGISFLIDSGECPGYFLAAFMFPLANVWLNDVAFYLHGYTKSLQGPRATLGKLKPLGLRF